jgi:hypothetical protein
MRFRLLLLALVFGVICFALGYILRDDAPPPHATPTSQTTARRGPEIRIDETKIELLPGSALTIDAGPPPDVSSH